MDHYKSWAGLNQELHEALCPELRNRITYFLTRYHDVHNAYGRAAIRLDGKELVIFSWIERCRQESDAAAFCKTVGNLPYAEIEEALQPKWDANGVYCDMDFLDAALQYRSLSIQDALASENCIVKIFAVMDRRIGRRTLDRLREEGLYRQYPAWVRQFYELRFAG